MLTYEILSGRPDAFKSMTGVSVEEFGSQLAEVKPRYEAMVKGQIERADRRRAPGAGVQSRYDVRERLLMTLVWLRLYVICDAIGVLFGVDKSTVSRFIRPILLILQELGTDTLGWPQEAQDLAKAVDDEPCPADQDEDPPVDAWAEANEWPKGVDRHTVQTPDESTCPDDSAIVDATEQRVQRSSVYETQKKFYSGKRKAHTVKTQIVVNEKGRIRQVSDSVPGSTHDLTLLRQSGLTMQLPPGVPLVADCGYRGMQNDFPNHSVILPYRPQPGEKLTPEEKDHNQIVSTIRVVVENTIAELKHFQALATKFRHCFERYKQVFDAIVGIVNRRIDKRLGGLAIHCSAHA